MMQELFSSCIVTQEENNCICNPEKLCPFYTHRGVYTVFSGAVSQPTYYFYVSFPWHINFVQKHLNYLNHSAGYFLSLCVSVYGQKKNRFLSSQWLENITVRVIVKYKETPLIHEECTTSFYIKANGCIWRKGKQLDIFGHCYYLL